MKRDHCPSSPGLDPGIWRGDFTLGRPRLAAMLLFWHFYSCIPGTSREGLLMAPKSLSDDTGRATSFRT